MVLKLVLLPIHSFWRRKSYMVLKLGGWTTGLEEDKIAGFSNLLLRCKDKEIAGHSNSRDSVRRTTSGLEEDKITWYSNTCYTLMKNYRALKFGNTVLRRFGEG